MSATATKKATKKDKTIAVRVPADLAERIESAADKELLTSSAWIRRTVLFALQASEANIDMIESTK